VAVVQVLTKCGQGGKQDQKAWAKRGAAHRRGPGCFRVQ
jgi:hypothetical protein